MTTSAFILSEVQGGDSRMALTGEEQCELHGRTLRLAAPGAVPCRDTG